MGLSSLLLLIVCAQAQAAPDAAVEPPAAPAIVPWPGELSEGLARLRESVGSDAPEEVVALAA